MDNYIAELRQPTESFFSSAMGSDIQRLIRSFALIRRCRVSSAEEASKYYFLEHILRLTTEEEEFQEAKNMMKPRLAEIMTELHYQKYEKQQKVIHSLESTITADMLNKFKPDIKITLFTWNGNGIDKEEMVPDKQKFPICFIYTDQRSFHILYTPNMNMVDGYCTTTGEYKKPNNIPSLFKRISELFYEENKEFGRKTIPRKKEETKGRDEPPPPVPVEKKEITRVEEPPKPVPPKKKDTPKFIVEQLSSSSSEEIKHEKPEKPETAFKVESASDDDSDEDDFHDLKEEPPKESYNPQLNRYTIRPPPKEYKRWEELEQKAIQARKDRDLCHALSCIIQ